MDHKEEFKDKNKDAASPSKGVGATGYLKPNTPKIRVAKFDVIVRDNEGTVQKVEVKEGAYVGTIPTTWAPSPKKKR